ncbi:MAG TPA: class I SAM-dependent methyltransferase [Sphingobium sp.]
MRSSNALYDALAPDYDAHFDVPHRRAYDDLSWEIVTAAMPSAPARLLDVGAGVGRWSERLSDRGYAMVGIEPADEMARHAQVRMAGRDFTLIHARVEDAELPPASIDGAFAMGSLQYSDNITASLRRIGGWLRPGAPLFVLADSAAALGIEMIARGEPEAALERMESRWGLWTQHGLIADLHLFSRAVLEEAFRQAGFEQLRSHGLLVGASALGRERLMEALTRDYEGQLEIERKLAREDLLVDFGKQLLVGGVRAAT